MTEPTAQIDSDLHPDADRQDRHAQFLMRFLASEKEIFRYICAIVPNVADAQDLLQQTALALWKKFDEYDPAQPFTPWACRFALLEAKSFLRRQERWRALLDGDLAEVLLRRRESIMAEMDLKFGRLNDCLGKLPQPHGQLVNSYYFQRKTVDDLARATGRSADAIYKSLQRIRKLLLDCVSTPVPHEEPGI